MKFFLKNKLDKPDVVFFDLDNTIYDYNSAHTFAMNQVGFYFFKKHNLSKKKFFFFFKKAKKLIKNQLGKTASSHNRLIYFQKLFEIMNLDSQIKSTLKLEELYWKFFLKKAYLFSGLLNFLKYLKKKNIPTGIITDLTSQIQFKKIKYFKIDKYFSNITTSEESIFDKPKKKIFIIAKKKFKKTKNIWMIGDSLLCDIKGSKEAINAVTFHKAKNTYPKYKNIKPDFSFKNYVEINYFFNNLINDAK